PVLFRFVFVEYFPDFAFFPSRSVAENSETVHKKSHSPAYHRKPEPLKFRRKVKVNKNQNRNDHAIGNQTSVKTLYGFHPFLRSVISRIVSCFMCCMHDAYLLG